MEGRKIATPPNGSISEVQELITPDIQSQLDEFMKADIPANKEAAGQSSVSRFLEDLRLKFFRLNSDETEKMMRLLAYIASSQHTSNNERITEIYLTYSLAFLGSVVAALVLPRKKIVKAFGCLGCFGLKTIFFDDILAFKLATEMANTNVLEDISQEHRSILTFYLSKKLEKETDMNPRVRSMLTDLKQEMEENTKDYLLYKRSEHLL